MTYHRRASTLFACATIAVSPAAGAQEAPALQPLLACRAIADAARRLACYDDGARALAEAVARKDVVVVDQDQVAATRRSLFGYPLPRIPLLEARAADKAAADPRRDATPDRLDTTLRSVSRAGDRWVLVIAEGSRWEQVEAGREADDPRAGMPISIRRASFGSYFAKIGPHITMRIRRVG